MNADPIPDENLPSTDIDTGVLIDRLLKVTAGNDHRLSDMADNKAQILITVNSIILSAIISLVLGRLKDTKYLVVPSFILLATSLITLVLAILATRPSLPKGRFTTTDVADKKVNLLFFGNFYKMKMKDYTAGMTSTLSDQEYLYQSLLKDEYNQGIVLGRKYTLLRVAYNVFMFGLIIVILWLLLSFFYTANVLAK
jgi:hypothetical protein